MRLPGDVSVAVAMVSATFRMTDFRLSILLTQTPGVTPGISFSMDPDTSSANATS